MSTMQPNSRRQRRAAARADAGGGGRPAGPRPGSVRPARPGRAPARQAAWRSPFVLVTLGAVAVMAVVIGGLLLSQGGGRPTDATGLVRPPDTAYGSLAQGDTLGQPDAPVVVEVYSDYQCPICGRFAREYLPRLVGSVVADGTARIVERSIVILDPPGGRESLDAAAGASCAARENLHWQFHDWVMWNQRGENEGAFSRDRLRAMADRVGLDPDAFAICLDDPEVRGEITTRTQEALAAGIDRTPTFVVNGEQIVGLPAYDDLVAAIEEAAAAQ